ncbi:ionotropic receptor 75a isoform X1 [Megalopta genalis]|uniref:ionotropic receptor 75a isoform X1 n=1 Tax=Megalopta genalis TaxID=115081 RepID=UPI003FD052B6
MKLQHECFACSCLIRRLRRRGWIASGMYFRMFLGLQLIIASCADNTDFIRDYFLFKKINRVAGFSCGNPENDFKTAKVLNDAGMTVSLTRFGSNIDLLRFLWTEYGNLGVFLDLGCSDEDDHVSNIYDEASAQYLFEHLHHWLILEEDGKNLTETAQLLNESTFSVITNFMISIRNDDGYALYDVYNHCKHCGGSLIITEFGTWTNNTGLSVNLLDDTFSRRWNHHQIKVKAAGVVGNRPKDHDLITYLQEPNVVPLDNWARFGFALTVHMAEMFNFTLDVIELNYWAKHDKNGPLMNGLKQRKFDLGFFPSIVTKERLAYADVALQVWPARTCFMFLTVPSLKSKLTTVFRPFEASVWCTIFALSILIIFALWLIWKLDNNSNNGESVFVLIAAICQQGLPFESKQFAGRIALLQTMIFGLLVYNCYSAAMVSSRLNIPLDKLNDSLYSLVKSKLKLSARKEIFFNILMSSADPEVEYFKRHWENIPEEKRFQELQDGITSVMSPGHAYHANPVDAYPVIERLFTKQMICQLTEIHLLRPSVLAIWFMRNGQFREISKIGLIRMTTAGIRNRQIHQWSSRKPFCEQNKHYVSSVTILETTSIIILLLVGVILSVIICMIENVVFRMSQRKLVKITTSKHSKKIQHQNKAVDKQKPAPRTKLITTSIKK